MVSVQIHLPNIGWVTQRKTTNLEQGLLIFNRNVDEEYCSRVLVDGEEHCQHFGLRSPKIQPEIENDEVELNNDVIGSIQLGLTF